MPTTDESVLTEAAEFDRIWSGLEIASRRARERPPVTASRPFPRHLRFGQAGNARDYQLFGWNHAERDYTWTEGREAFLELPPANFSAPGFLNIRVAPLLHSQVSLQRVRVSVGAVCVAHWEISVAGHYFAFLPAPLLTVSQSLVFYVTDATSPRDLGLSDDDRQLALQFYELWLTPWVSPTF